MYVCIPPPVVKNYACCSAVVDCFSDTVFVCTLSLSSVVYTLYIYPQYIHVHVHVSSLIPFHRKCYVGREHGIVLYMYNYVCKTSRYFLGI